MGPPQINSSMPIFLSEAHNPANAWVLHGLNDLAELETQRRAHLTC